MGLFQRQQTPQGQTQVPVWFMRQAGRYHQHYQNIKKNSDFMTMCKDPQLAAKITMGPIEDFGFDAAILFSDLLFPLEQMGFGLNYHQGPPMLDWHLQEQEDIQKMTTLSPSETFYQFQKTALSLLKEKNLPQDKTLLGFVGAPFTLYTYAVEGQHAGQLVKSKQGFYDGRYEAFMQHLLPLLQENMSIQAEGGADAVCLFDTAAGELCLEDYLTHVVPLIRQLTKNFKRQWPHKKIVYYSKLTHLHYHQKLEDPNVDVLGIDWRCDLAQTIKTLGSDYMIQGNMDPGWLHLPWPILQKKLMSWKTQLEQQKVDFSRWIFGLGHGVLIKTPEENVRQTVRWVHQHLLY
jgi:uroporphyrinogen decarboxylase